jgi:predicted RNA-binding Zn-ribbon protein involved in translation (DUF1610 family)
MQTKQLISFGTDEGDVYLQVSAENSDSCCFCLGNVRRIQPFLQFLEDNRNPGNITSFLDLNHLHLAGNGEIIFSMRMGAGRLFNVRCESVTIQDDMDFQRIGPATSDAFAVFPTSRALGGRSSGDGDAITKLTAAHFCSQCKRILKDELFQELRVSAPKATLNCNACDERTSVYAVLHHCENCAILLESPSRLAGKRVSCPGCQFRNEVPSQELLYSLESSLLEPETRVCVLNQF